MKERKWWMAVILFAALLFGVFAVSAAAEEAPAMLATPHITACESLDSGVRITWNAVDDAALYRVYYKGSNGWTRIGDTAETSFVDTNVSSGSTYTYTVRCLNAEANRFTSDFDRSGYRYTYNLATPQITSLVSTAEGVAITWDAVPNAARYRVYYKNAKGGWTKMTETDSTSYLDQDVNFGSTYTYTVRCVNAAGTKFTSAFNTGGSRHTHYLATPQITGFSSDQNGVYITWGAVEGAAKYRVYYKNSKGGWTRMAETADTSCPDADVSYGSTYTYTVRCVDEAGKFTSSYNSTGWRYTYYCDTPQITGFESVGKGVKITWDKVDGAEKYRVYYKGRNGWTRMGDTTSTTFIDEDVKVGSTYRYTVRCLNSAANKFTSSYGADGWTYQYNPQLATPQITKITAASNGAQIQWDPVEGADLYRVYYYHGGWTKIAETRETNVIDTNIQPSQTLTYTVRCLSAGGKGFASDFDHSGTAFHMESTPVLEDIEVHMDGISFTVFGGYHKGSIRVYRKTAGTSWQRIGEVTDLARFTDTNVEPGKTYTYTARSLNENGDFASMFYAKGWSQSFTVDQCIPELEFFIYVEKGVALIQPKEDNKFGITHFELDLIVDGDYQGTYEITDEPCYIQNDYIRLNHELLFYMAGVDKNGNLITDFDESGIWVYMLDAPTNLQIEKTGDRQYRFSWSEGQSHSFGYNLNLYTSDGELLVDSGLIKDSSYDVDLSAYPEDTEWMCIVWMTTADEISASLPIRLDFKEADFQDVDFQAAA